MWETLPAIREVIHSSGFINVSFRVLNVQTIADWQERRHKLAFVTKPRKAERDIYRLKEIFLTQSRWIEDVRHGLQSVSCVRVLHICDMGDVYGEQAERFSNGGKNRQYKCSRRTAFRVFAKTGE